MAKKKVLDLSVKEKGLVNIARLKCDTNTREYKDQDHKLVVWVNKKISLHKQSARTYKKYISGQIIYIDFGYNVGNEFSFDHYAVVLKDSHNNDPLVNVVPITSKSPQSQKLYPLKHSVDQLIINALEIIKKTSRNESKVSESNQLLEKLTINAKQVSNVRLRDVAVISKLRISEQHQPPVNVYLTNDELDQVKKSIAMTFLNVSIDN